MIVRYGKASKLTSSHCGRLWLINLLHALEVATLSDRKRCDKNCSRCDCPFDPTEKFYDQRRFHK